MNSKPIPPKDESVQIPLVWAPQGHLTTAYANHLAITQTDTEFYLVFGELVPPAILKDFPAPAKVEITPVTRLVISKPAMYRILEVLNKNVRMSKGDD
jgi:hypothetical protein